jgi:uncharacterized protein (TIGR00661 family)
MTKINEDYDPEEKSPGKPRILVAPLDWGLGHATRCIPVIYELLAQNADVWLAGERSQETLLKEEFPQLPMLQLKGYRVSYGRSGPGLLRTLLLQIPRLLQAALKENEWLHDGVKKYEFDAVISDNRFGLHHPSIPSVFITHQLQVQSPWRVLSESLLRKMNYRFINRFTCCWIPDFEDGNGLAGKLSHPTKKPAIPCYYTGPLSRLKKTGIAEEKKHLFISLSGPEPQRSILENKLVNQVSHYNGTAVIVRGLPGNASLIPSTNDIRFYNHLPAEEYNREMQRADYVISRSGYSTIMDLLAVGKRSILIPTPGQTEQEYLAVHLEKMKAACWANQKDFVLDDMLQKAMRFPYNIPGVRENKLAKVVSDLLLLVKNNAHRKI